MKNNRSSLKQMAQKNTLSRIFCAASGLLLFTLNYEMFSQFKAIDLL